LLAVLTLIASAGGCGDEDSGTMPVACDTNPGAVQKALAKAPGRVTIGGTRLSECFVRNADQAQIQQLGATVVEAAEALAERARGRPHSREAVQLGYLVGAVHRGARKAQGIYYETERRLEQALIGLDTRTSEYRRGQQAGARSG
jgi:hypothetical protein